MSGLDGLLSPGDEGVTSRSVLGALAWHEGGAFALAVGPGSRA